jgi:hypothetical protein
MGNYGTYCGTLEVYYMSQVAYEQLTNYVDEAAFNNWLLGTLIPSAEKTVDGYCNRSFGTPSYGTFSMDGNGSSWLPFPPKHTPLIGFSAGSVNGSGITIGDVKVYDTYIRREGSGFPDGKQNVVLYGSYGFLDHQRVPVVPADVRVVTATMCANVIADMVRRNIAPEIFRNLVFRQYQQNTEELTSLFVLPMLFSQDLKNRLDPYRVSWIDIG